MGFWIFMFIIDLLIPLTMIGFGKYFKNHAPEQINAVFGYRTNMSMKNMDTWKFAHHYCGKIWSSAGWIIGLIAVIAMIFVGGKNEDMVGTVGGIVCGIQLIVLVGSIFPIEYALKKKFDKNGQLKQTATKP